MSEVVTSPNHSAQKLGTVVALPDKCCPSFKCVFSFRLAPSPQGQ